MTINYVGLNKIRYPLHRHPNWEILYYTEGKGHLSTETESLPYEKGTILIIPPNTYHGTIPDESSVNISVGGDFNNRFMFDSPVGLTDNPACDGEALVKLIFNNQHSSSDYLSALCAAYVEFILSCTPPRSPMHLAVNKVISSMTRQFYDSGLDTAALLKESGYAEDHIRSRFKDMTGYTPVGYLTKLRIDNAKKLFEIYGDNITVSSVSEACGFDDPIYFSKRFKEHTGTSPARYKKLLSKHKEQQHR